MAAELEIEVFQPKAAATIWGDCRRPCPQIERLSETEPTRRIERQDKMADHGHSSSEPVLTGMDAHRATYEGFLSGSVALALVCFYVLVALVTFRFMDNPLNLIVGFGGIVIGCIATLIGLKAGKNWLIPGVVLVLYGLFVAANIHMS